MDAKRAEAREAEQAKVEAAHTGFQQRREEMWNNRFQEAQDFHDDRAAKRKAKKLDTGAKDRMIQKAVENDREFQARIAAHKEEMDEYIPLKPRGAPASTNAPRQAAPQVKTDTLKLEDGNWQVSRDERGGSEEQASEPLQKINPPPAPPPKKPSPAVVEVAPSDDGSLEDLAPIPIRRKLYEDTKYEHLKLGSVKSPSTISSLHTGAQLHVNQVPSEMVPSTKGISVLGTYPHASVWTKSPRWAQTAVGVGMGAILGGLGFGIFKLVGKMFNRTRAAKGDSRGRLHAREWNPVCNEN
jgi:hypothetical protein